MMAIPTYANAVLDSLTRHFDLAKRRGVWKPLAAGAAGFALSAASLANRAMPIALGLLCAAPPGIYAIAIALGGCLGYLLFWGETQAVAWMAAGLLAVALVGDHPIAQRQKLLLPAVAALVVSGCGVVFALCLWDNTSVPVYLLRVVLSSAATAVWRQWRSEPNGTAGWLACGLVTLSLAQIAPARFLCLGYLAAGFLGVRCSFPAVAMAGLGLDLAQVTKIPMTGVLCLSFCLRLIPRQPKTIGWSAPALTFCVLSAAVGNQNFLPLPALLLGGLLGEYLPGNQLTGTALRRKGPTGLVQVRLEKAAVTLQKMEHTLLLTQEPDLDSRSLLRQAADASCDTCPERKGCKARHQIPALPTSILEQPGLQTGDLPPGCRKTGRLLTELRRGQEQLRRIKGDRHRQNAYRTALLEQYSFLSEYLRTLSDNLCATNSPKGARFRPEIGICSRSLEGASGDKCVHFEGVDNLQYLLLCDGMGTGEAAAQDSQEAVALLRQFLEAGLPPCAALRSFNSLCALRSNAGCATADLLEMDLRTGKCTLYKWGAAPSYQIIAGQLRKIGTAGPPPGLSQLSRESVDRLSLGGGEVLIMLSDGAGAEGLARPQWTTPEPSAGEMAAWILEHGAQRFDDATVAVVRLQPLGLATQ